jgi:hypothetical protein
MISDTQIKRMKTTLKNAGYVVDDNVENIRSEYSKYCSLKTKQSYKKWYASNMKLDESFSVRAKKGMINSGKRLFGNELSDEHALELFKKSLGGTKQSEAIKVGLLNKFGTKEAISLEYAKRKKNVIASNLGKQIDDVTLVDLREYHRKIGFFNKNVFNWKKKQAEKFIGKLLDDKDVENVYSEYLSDRFKRTSLECITNGWTNTKKGWYPFISHDNKMFYRSSWELSVFEILDELYASGVVQNIKSPNRIGFVYMGSHRHYYPDVEWTLSNGQCYICEIKPMCKVHEPINIAKFEAARNLYHESFVIVTETELKNLKNMEYMNV